MKYAPSVHKLSNGLTVLLDPMDIATAAMSVDIHVGARDEAPHEYGITHFLEHILNKGTARFPTAKSLKNYILDNGGTSNASTSSATMQLYGRILTESFYILADSLADKLQNSLFDPTTIENEKSVIQDELRRTLDQPDYVFYYYFKEKIFKNTGHNHNTLGTIDTINSFTPDQLHGYYKRNLTAQNIIIGISGKFDQTSVLDDLEKLYGQIPSFNIANKNPVTISPGVHHLSKKDSANIKLQIAFEDIWPWEIDTRYQSFCVNIFENVLAKRLHENVRDKNGLVYAIGIYSDGDEFKKINYIETETAPNNLGAVIKIIAQVCFDIMNGEPVTEAEIKRQKTMTRFHNANWLEKSGQRNNKLIRIYRKFNMVYDLDKDIDMINSVKLEDIMKYSKDYFSKPISILTMGPDSDLDLKSIWDKHFK